ncbi:MAG: hypothetical protein R3E84_13140 [Pseudomonadales bacterium]
MTESTLQIDDLAVLLFHGPESGRFLQGYLTCDTAELGEHWQLTALCNLQGRVVVSGWARRHDEGVELLVHREMAEATLTFLSPYLRLARARASLRENVAITLRMPTGEDAPLEFSIGTASGASSHADDNRLLSLLCLRRVVLIRAATSARFLPQALGLVAAGAVAFDKGCYLGQEVVARAQHRGQVKRHLQLTAAPTDPQPTLGERYRDPVTGIEGDLVQTSSAGCLVVSRGNTESAPDSQADEAHITS